VNGDGVDDLLIGDYEASINPQDLSGAAFVLYGSKNGLPRTMNLTMLERDQGYRITGPGRAQDWFGYWVNPAGDVNDDGINDMMNGLVSRDVADVVNGTHGTSSKKKNNEQISL